MNPSRQSRPSDTEVIEATAAAWLAQRDDGLTPEQAEAFARWRAASPRHEAAVARLEAAWTALQQLREFRPEAARHPDRDLLGAASRRRMAILPARAGLAIAAIVVLGVCGWFALSLRDIGHARERIATAADGYQRVTLPDGSLVELNGSTELRVRYAPAGRRVRLLRGEAHFTVVRDPNRPFFVEAGPVSVEAVGTAFNVRMNSADVEVLVTQGRVAVAQGAAADAPAGAGQTRAESASRSAPAYLAANERVVIQSTRSGTTGVRPALPVIEKVTAETVRKALAWQGPRLVFVDTPLGDVIAQFNRRNAVQLELDDPALGALPIGGSFRAENVEAFVRLLASDGDIRIERPSPDRIVLQRAR